MTPRARLGLALPVLALASLGLAGCGRSESPPPAKNELPVEQTPVQSIYEEKPGVLYEQPARTPTVTPAPPAPTPSPRTP